MTMTFNELVNEAIEKAKAHRDLSGPEAAREFSIAITSLEDALTRFNGGVYRRAGTWNRADAEQVTGLTV